MSRERSVSSSSGFTDLYGPLFYCSFLFHLLIYMMRIRDMCKEAYIYICFSSGVDSDPRHVMVSWEYTDEVFGSGVDPGQRSCFSETEKLFSPIQSCPI